MSSSIKERYVQPASQYSSFSSTWIEMFWRIIHIMPISYSPQNRQHIEAMKCFYISLSKIIPTPEAKKVFQSFILMNRDTAILLMRDPRLSILIDQYKASDYLNKQFLDWCLQDNEHLFLWTYLLHAYFNIIRPHSSIIHEPPWQSLEELKNEYNQETITKEIWGNAMWYVIHSSACQANPKFNSSLDKEWKLAYKAFISCLQFVLPCQTCRDHLKNNLCNINIDDYMTTCKSIFEWSTRLHNIVNQALDKPSLTFDECLYTYSHSSQPWMKQNMQYFL